MLPLDLHLCVKMFVYCLIWLLQLFLVISLIAKAEIKVAGRWRNLFA